MFDGRMAHLRPVRYVCVEEGRRKRGAMRHHLTLLVCCLAAWSAPSRAASIDHIDITAYGIMYGLAGVQDGVGSNGIEHRLSKGDKVVDTTTRIPACLGTRFGITYSLVGVPDGTPVNIVEVYNFPHSGLHRPGAPSPIHDTEFERALMPGTDGNEIWYEFDKPWELVPGEWTLEISDGERLLASKTFTVVSPKQGACDKLSA